MKVASYFTKLDNLKVRCELCPHRCLLTDKKRGICLTRQNIGGTLISLNYARPVSIAIDPIEKKPLYHFHPGTRIFSTGPNGCSFKCGFCQNCEIAQATLQVREMSVQRLLQEIMAGDTIGVAYTYSEPTIWHETIMELGALVKQQGLVNVMVTNGYVEQRPLGDLLTVVDAMNIDIKSINPQFYKRICKGDLGPVLATCETVKKQCHLEITNLLITDENDSIEEVHRLSKYIAANLGADTPLHLSRYFPRHRFTKPATSEKLLLAAWEKARESLSYVYLGNASIPGKESTWCPGCGTLLIERRGYRVGLTEQIVSAHNGGKKCGQCGRELRILLHART
jgi:pyruvate formate lyase activating enzyme